MALHFFRGIDGSTWVAVKELNLSYHIGETFLITMYIPIMVTYVKLLNNNPGTDVAALGAAMNACAKGRWKDTEFNINTGKNMGISRK